MKRKILGCILSVLFIGFVWINITQAQGVEETIDVGISDNKDCITWMWTDCFDYEKMVWLPDSSKRDTLSILQDVILASTYMVWTVLTIVIIYCGLMYILASWNWKDTSKYRKWLINAWIWAILVRSAYAIVRLLQYVSRW